MASLTTTALLLSTLPTLTTAILPTAAIDIYLPDTAASNAITLFASQASFGGQLATYDQRYHHFLEAGNTGNSRVDGVGVVPAFPPTNDPYLCNEADGLGDYSDNNANNAVDKTAYYQSALLVPRGQCSFEHKALSAQRLGANAIIIYGTLSSRYSLNYTNSTIDCDSEECNDAKTRTDYSTKDVLWPGDKYDYDCDYGKAYLPQSSYEGLDFVKMPGGYNEQNDDMLMGKTENNLCVKYEEEGTSFVNKCESQRCLVTGKNVTDPNGGEGAVKYEACCAWDLHVWLYGDSSISKESEDVTIPAVFITMQESSELLDVVRGASGSDPVVLSVYQRYRPEYNISAVLIWALGVFVAWISSYHSSLDIRKVGKAIMVQRELNNSRMDRAQQQQQPSGSVGGSGGGRGHNGARSRSNSPSASPPRGALEMGSTHSVASANERGSSNNNEAQERTIYRSDSTTSSDAVAALAARHVSPPQEESLELTASHAVGFLVMASTSLLVLFFFKIYNVVKIMYAFGCSGAFAQVIVHPGLWNGCRRLKWERPLKNVKWLSEEAATREALRGGIKGHVLNCLWGFFGPICPVDIAAMIISYGIGAIWLWVAFTIPHPDTVAFYWIVQNVFGLCMCMLFLETIKLNAIKVGAVLLIVAFFYDIFFVFVTPLLTKHGESIMVNVATSGGPPKADPSWCEKYPFDQNCKGGDPLPMLFALPRIGDYQGGMSMLGLGDIVLPGLLLSFASRYDESKRLMGLVSGGSGRVANNACPDRGSSFSNQSKSSNPLRFICCCCTNGYFGPVMVGYAIGLLMANAAVYIMQMGQPALLYLVPCCLGTMCVMAKRAGELQDLWDGPRVIRAADALMYGEEHVESAEVDEQQQREAEERRALEVGLEASMQNEETEMT